MTNIRRVAVTGLGIITPLGNTIASTWQALLAGKSAAGPITHFDASRFKTHFACEVSNFDPTQWMDRKEARKRDRYTQFAIATAQQAWEMAHLNMEREDPYRCGVIFGSGMGGARTLEDEISAYATGDGSPTLTPFFIPKILTSIAAGELAIRYGFKGVNYATTSACASSAHAIANAFQCIRGDLADVMLVGGSEAAVEFTGIGGFNALRALSTRNDDPIHASRPFSASRDGFVLGEGAGCLMLEEWNHAVNRGATIYAEVMGVGMNADAHHITAPDSNGAGAANAMATAIRQAQLQPADIDYINAHGTSTPLGDAAEVYAIRSVFGDLAPKLNISSSKSMTGHMLGGTGAAEAIITILSIQHGIITPTINHEDGDDDADFAGLNFTFNNAQERSVRFALSNAFGFGGQNVSLLFARPE